MSELAQLIIDNDLIADANAGDFSSVRTTLRAKTIEKRKTGKTSGKETLVALQFAGHDPEDVLEAVESSRVGRRLLGALDAEGVDWADPVTIALLDNLAAGHPKFGTAIRDTLVALNKSMTSPLEELGQAEATDQQLQDAWQAKQVADRITNAQALAGERITPDMDDATRAAAWAQAWEDAV